MGSERSVRPRTGAEPAFFCSSVAQVRSEGAPARRDHHPGPRGNPQRLWEVGVASTRFSLIWACSRPVKAVAPPRRYTYGKPVIGSVKAVVCRNAVSFYWFSSEQPRDICQTYQLTVRPPACLVPSLRVANSPPDFPDGQKRLRVPDGQRQPLRPRQEHVRGPLRRVRRAGGVRHR